MGEIKKVKCVICEKVFEASRSDADTCSTACRSKKFRKNRNGKIKSQVKTIKVQEKVINNLNKKIELKADQLVMEKAKTDPSWLAKTLSGIVFPSISRYRAGTLSEAERKEIERTANVMNMSVEEYMKDLEYRLTSATPTIRKLFE